MALLIGFYLGAAFYVGALSASGFGVNESGDQSGPTDFFDTLLTAVLWPLGLYEILKGR